MDNHKRKYNKMEQQNEIMIAVTDFSISPGPRYCNQGEDSGELFYHNVLNPNFAKACEEDYVICVVLDGADGYASSFLDEAFGNLVYDFGEDLVLKHIKIISEEEPEWIKMIHDDTFKQWQKRREECKSPKITMQHPAWVRFDGESFKSEVWANLK